MGGSPSGLSFASTSGSASGTTRTAVAEGQIEVRADALNGRDSTAGLSRDTAGANGSIGKIFDKDKVREKLEFQQALGQLGMQIAGDALKDLAKQDPETWGEGKIGSIALHAGVAGAAAALGGATWRARSPVRWRVTWPRAPCASRSSRGGRPPAGTAGDGRAVDSEYGGGSGRGLAGGVSGAGGAAVANMYNRQLHEEEGELIRKKASIYAERQGISIADAQAILTGQAQRQADSEAAKRFAENSSARAFLAEISLGLQGSGFAYFDGKADGSYDNQVLFAGGVKDSATLTTLYDAAWKRAQAGATKPTILTGSDLPWRMLRAISPTI